MSDDIQTKLKVLRDSYAEQLPGKIKEIEICWKKLLIGNKDSSDYIVVFHRLLHGLAGSGATFGFPEVGQQARHIEQILKVWMEGDIEPSNEEQDNLSVLLDQLGALILSLKSKDLDSISVSRSLLSPTNDVGALIYILDDDVGMSEKLARQIIHFGYQVKIYASTTDLIVALDNKLPKAVISDIIFQGDDFEGIK